MAVDSYSAMQSGYYGIQAASQLADAFSQSEALKAQSSFQRAMSEINQRMAGLQAGQVVSAGGAQANKIRQQGKKVQGAQRLAAAAQGLDVTDGSVAEQVEETSMAVAVDVLNTKNNAWREAWGIKTQASMAGASSAMEARARELASSQTLLSGGLRALGSGMQAGAAYAGRGRGDKWSYTDPSPGG